MLSPQHKHTGLPTRWASPAFLSFTSLQTISRKLFQASVVLAYRCVCVWFMCVRAHVSWPIMCKLLGKASLKKATLFVAYQNVAVTFFFFFFFDTPQSALPRFWGEALRLCGPHVEVVVNGVRLLRFSPLTISSQLHACLSTDLRGRRGAPLIKGKINSTLSRWIVWAQGVCGTLTLCLGTHYAQKHTSLKKHSCTFTNFHTQTNNTTA